MSWDAKREDGPRYYYRSRRIDGRAVKEYVGTGPLAEMASRMDHLDLKKAKSSAFGRSIF